MITTDDLIPRPPIVRERLAQTARELARLRRLLRLAEAAADDRAAQAQALRDVQAGPTRQREARA